MDEMTQTSFRAEDTSNIYTQPNQAVAKEVQHSSPQDQEDGFYITMETPSEQTHEYEVVQPGRRDEAAHYEVLTHSLQVV